MTANNNVLIEGEFFVGAYGPTLLMELLSVEAARFLSDAFMQIARGGEPLVLYPHPQVKLRNVASLELRHSPRRELRWLTKTDDNVFIWRCTSDEWRCRAGLMEPFVADRKGHQSLTSEVDDDGLVEVSMHENLRWDLSRSTPPGGLQ